MTPAGMTPARTTPAGVAGADVTTSGFDAELLVRRVVPVTHDVTSFVLEAPPGWDGRFEAGQHLVLSGPAGVERCYTISSPPTRRGTLTITVKRQPGGVMSPWLHEVVSPGDLFRARGPFGEFTFHDHPAAGTAGLPAGGYLFLSAGSGITPCMAMTRALADAASAANVVFVHSARSPADIIFRRELQALPEAGLDLSVTVVCEGDRPADRWPGPRGRLTADLLRWAAPGITDREVFVCGPPGYLTATLALLDLLGVDPERVHRETFTVGDGSALFTDPPVADDGSRVELRASGRVVTCPPGSTVLDAVAGAGVMLRSSCRQGLCGTCKLTLVEGRVDMRHQGGIRQREIDRGLFLPCCSRPLTDLVVEA